jgi:hypothetical protein
MLNHNENNNKETNDFHITNLIAEEDKLCDDIVEENNGTAEDHKEPLVMPSIAEGG